MKLFARSAALCIALIFALFTIAAAMGRKPTGPPAAPARGKPAMPSLPVTVVPAPEARHDVPAAPVPAASPVHPVSVAGAPHETPQPAATPKGPQPKIVFEELKHDFGEVVGVEKVEHIYRFRNNGPGELKVDKVSTTCGCTAALISSKEIPPGGKGEIKTTFTVGGRQGKQTKHIYVFSNDPIEPKACLILEGTIIPPLAVEPANVMLQDTKSESARTVRILQTMPEELTIEEPTTRLNLVTAKLRSDQPENGKKRYTIEITLKPDLETGRYSENLTVVTNCKTKPKIEIPVRITVNGDITASPSRISLGQLAPGQEVTRSITLASTRDQAFTILKIEIDNAAFTISPSTPPAPAQTYTFTVTGKPESATGGVRATVTFTLDHPKQKTIEVPIYGWLRVERTPVPPRAAPQGSPAPAAAGQVKP
ncbi:MAG: DUF1573 domain-containing protein [Chlamydiota bacterium]